MGFVKTLRRRYSSPFNPRKRSSRFARQTARTRENQTITSPVTIMVMLEGFTIVAEPPLPAGPRLALGQALDPAQARSPAHMFTNATLQRNPPAPEGGLGFGLMGDLWRRYEFS